MGSRKKTLLAGYVLCAGLLLFSCTSVEKIPSEQSEETVAEEKTVPVKKDKEKDEDKIAEDVAVNKILSEMTLEQKIGQMIMPSIYKRPNSYESSVTKINQQIKSAVEKYGFGGIILFKVNTSSSSQTLTLVHDLQSAATDENSESKIPLLIGIDQEGGNIIRLTNSCWMPGNMLVGASGNPNLSEDYARLVGSELSAIGVNVNFAPCADVNCNPANPIIGLRSFSSDPNLVAKMIGGSIKGYAEENVVSALKHFPGHGDTAVDSHQGLPRITKTFDEMKNMELVPFASGIKSGAEMIMTAHIQFPDIESETYTSISTGSPVYLPATLSKKIITGILREKLGFSGVVITDAMDMGAVTTHFRKIDAAKLAINAGVDILLMACDISSASETRYAGQLISSLVDAVASGEIPEERINESVERILRLKYRYGILEWKPDLEKRLAKATSFVGSLENHQKEWDITAEGITVVKNENNLLPLTAEKNHNIGILYPFASEKTSVKYAVDYVKQKISCDANISLISYSDKSFGYISNQLARMDVVVVISELSKPAQFNQFLDRSSRFALVNRVIEDMHGLGKKVVLISAELPYDIAAYSESDAIVAAYGSYEMKRVPGVDASKNIGYGPNIPVSVATVFGAVNPAGKIPVDIFALDKNFNYTDKIIFKLGTGLKF